MAGINSLLFLFSTLAPIIENPSNTISETTQYSWKVPKYSSAFPECPLDEEYLGCGPSCRKDCSTLYHPSKFCSMKCIPGCFCKEGMVRGPDSSCIWPRECPNYSSKDKFFIPDQFHIPFLCKADEVWKLCSCPVTCDNYKNENSKCPFICIPNCECKEGMVRAPDGRCVNPQECEPEEAEKTQNCTELEYFDECGPNCEINCATYNMSEIPCEEKCVKGCFCQSGYIRREDGECVLPSECSQEMNITLPLEAVEFKRCPKHEEYYECGTVCPKNCNNWKYDVPCTQQCIKGCFCKGARVRGPDGRCIYPTKCPISISDSERIGCEANEVYDLITGGCKCKPQFVRGPNDECNPDNEIWHEIPDEGYSREESARCPIHERYLDCGTACPKNCSNWREEKLPCSMECVRGCFCEGARVRDTDGKCIWPSECPAVPEYSERIGCQVNEVYDLITGGCKCKPQFVRGPNDECNPDNEIWREIPDDDYSREASSRCSSNEHYSICGSDCTKNCSNWSEDIICTDTRCVSGCFCNDGLIRGPDRRCIWPRECPRTYLGQIPASLLCEKDEVFKLCSSLCPDDCNNYQERNRTCKKFCIPGCECKDGKVRGPSGECVEPNECPSVEKKQEDCAESEYYDTCGTACEINCSNYHLLERQCPEKHCVSGCFCEPGYVRGENDDCIWASKCTMQKEYSLFSKDAECGENAIYIELKGCVCKENYVRGSNGECERQFYVPLPINSEIKDFNKCGEHEIFKECGSICIPDCYTDEEVGPECEGVCFPGCFCEEHYVRGPDGKCIRLEECSNARTQRA